jgi:hypothetical protein
MTDLQPKAKEHSIDVYTEKKNLSSTNKNLTSEELKINNAKILSYKTKCRTV